MNYPRFHCHAWDNYHKQWLVNTVRVYHDINDVTRVMGRTLMSIISQMLRMMPGDYHFYSIDKLHTDFVIRTTTLEIHMPKENPVDTAYRIVMSGKTQRRSDDLVDAENIATALVVANPGKEVTIYKAMKRVFMPHPAVSITEY